MQLLPCDADLPTARSDRLLLRIRLVSAGLRGHMAGSPLGDPAASPNTWSRN
jgi:hypothetical protein